MKFYVYKIKKKYINDEYSKIEKNISSTNKLKITNKISDNLFLSNKLLSYKWDIFSTKYGFYKSFKNNPLIGNCFLIYPNKKPDIKNINLFKNKKVYIKPSNKSCLNKEHFCSGKGIIITNNIKNIIEEKKYNDKVYNFVQESIDNPILINGYKADMRLYLLITKNNKNLVFYLSNKFDIKIANCKYNINNCDTKDKLTNWGELLRIIVNKYMSENKTSLSYNEIYYYIHKHYFFGKNFIHKGEYEKIMESYFQADYNSNILLGNILPISIRKKMFKYLKKHLSFNFLKNVQKTNIKVMNEYQIFAIDLVYDTKNKKVYIYEINGKIIPPGMGCDGGRKQFRDILKDKESIINNLIENKHISCGCFKKIFHKLI